MRKLRLLCSFVVLLCASVQGLAQITSVSFTATPRTGCGQVLTSFTSTVVSANPVTYNWDFGDGTSSGFGLQSNPGHLYVYDPLKPCYTVTLTVTDGIETKSSTRTNYICVYKKPVAQFAAAAGNSTTGCAPLTVQLIDQSTATGGNIVSWVWSSQGGTPQSVGNTTSPIPAPGIPNPTFTWNAQGTYAPTLTVTDNNGCKETIQKNGFITVTPTPVANFNSPAPNSCTTPHTVTFTNTSVAPAGTTYQWLINGQTFNTTGNQSPPAQTFTTGTYDVQLIAIGAGSTPCRDTLLLPAYVNVGGTFNFSYTPNGGCVGTTVSFTAPVGSTDHVWDFGDGGGGVGPQIDHPYLTAGCYTPSLTATLPGGCRTTVSSPTQICISNPPTPTFTIDKVNFCSTPIVVNFTSPAPPSPTMTCAWTFNNSTYTAGPNFSAICGNQSSINYNPGDFVSGIANPTLTWTDTLGCVGTFSLPINYKPLTAAFNLSKVEGCVGSAYISNFTNIAAPPVFNSTNTVNWFLDNAPYATGITPPTPYNFASVTPCTHTFRMEVTNTLGCSASATKDIKGGTKPTAVLSFSPASTCAQFPVLFNVSASSSSPCALDSKMRLSYGDGEFGTTFSTAPISHIYRDTISFCRKKPYLTVYSGGCASDSVQAGCIAITPSIAKFEVVKTCADKTLFNFNAIGNTPNSLNSIADNCSWQITPNAGVTFETGLQTGPTTVTPSNPAAQAGKVGVRFTTPGTYTVVLTTSQNAANGGCTQTASKTIIVANPLPSFTTTNGQGCAPLTVQITGTTTDPTGVQSSVFSYVQAPVTPPAVAPTGVPVFSAPTALTGGNVVFPSPGAYDNVVLTVTDVNGCTTSSSLGGFQVQGSAVNFTSVPNPAEGCVPTQVVFTSVVTPFPSTAIVKNYAWDLKNDGVRYAGAAAGTSEYYEYSGVGATTAAYTIGQAGVYQLKHSIITQIPGGGVCKDSIIKLGFTGYAPVAVFAAPATRCTGQPFTVTNTSAGTGLTHTWYESVGGGTLIPKPSYVGATPTITYQNQGTYILCDQVTESTTLACKDSICRQIIVADPIISFTGTDLSIPCPPLSPTLTSTSQNLTILRWEIWPEIRDGNGNFIRVKYTETGSSAQVGTSTQSPFSLTLTEPGCYTVKLFGTTASGCLDSLVQNSYICISGPSADIAIRPTTGCAPVLSTYVITNAVGQISIAYNTKDTDDRIYVVPTNASADSLTHPYATPGTYYPTFLLDDGQGCQILLEPQIPIVVDSASGWTGSIKNNICRGDSAIIYASSAVTGATYQWALNGTFDIANATDSILTVGPTVTTTYTVTITDPNGCAKIDNVTVFVKGVSLPTVTIAPPAPIICKGSEILISATGVQDGTTISNASGYNWDPLGLGLSQYAAIINPVARPDSNTVYTVTVTGAQGCTGTGTILITIIQPVIDMVGDNRTICKGGSVLLEILASANVNTPEWSPSNGLSTLFAPTTIANPLTTQQYIVKAKDNNTGCPVRDTITVFVLEPNLVSAGPDKAFCAGSSVILDGTVPTGTAVGAGGTINWTPQTDLVGFDIEDPTVTILNPNPAPVEYVIAYTKDLCILEDKVLVRPLDKAAITGTGGSICRNGNIQLNVEGFANFFTWTPANTLSADNIPNPIASPLETTTYNVTGSLGGNCAVDVIQVTVNVNQLPNLAVSPQNTTFFPKQGLNVKLNVTTDPSNLVNWTSVVVESTPALTLYAHTGSALVLYQPIVPGGPRQSQYVVKATDANSCTNTVVVTLTERTECEDSQIFVPSAFSPNADGNNDVLYARGSALNGITVFRVFDRWGNLMFETTDIKKGWDGTYQGKLVNPDVYVYYMEAPCSLDGRPIFKKGNVTVVR
jgi:gliding motility-associated-like protein